MVKEKLNNIDNQLKLIFEDVKFSTKNYKNNIYYEFKSKGKFVMNDGSSKIIESIIKIDKVSLYDDKKLNWSYSIDPRFENSHYVDRSTEIEEVGDSINDIISNGKMDIDYISSLDDVNEVDIKDDNVDSEIINLLNTFEVENIIEYEDIKFGSMKKIIECDAPISYNKYLELESELKKLGYEYVTFNNNKLVIMVDV